MGDIVASQIYSPIRRRTLQEDTMSHTASSNTRPSLPAMTNTSIRKIFCILCIPLLIFLLQARRSTPAPAALRRNLTFTRRFTMRRWLSLLTVLGMGLAPHRTRDRANRPLRAETIHTHRRPAQSVHRHVHAPCRHYHAVYTACPQRQRQRHESHLVGHHQTQRPADRRP